jgi:NADH-quinone oxidoreductase subunit E
MENLRNFDQVCAILKAHDHNPNRLISILQAVQEVYRYLPEEAMTFIATSLQIPPAKVFGVASFYAHFTLQPKGRYVIKVCDGTACHVKKSTDIQDALCKHLDLNPQRNTTADMLFTLETVSCLGTCGLAPAVVINDEVHGLMTPQSAVELVKDIQARETAVHA